MGGTQALGVPAGVLGDFPQAFQQGPAARAGQDPDFADTVGLGDVGDSDPEHWILGGQGTETVHILLSLYTDEHRVRKLDAVSVRLRDRFAATGLHEIWTEDANALPHGGVHFHYRRRDRPAGDRRCDCSGPARHAAEGPARRLPPGP